MRILFFAESAGVHVLRFLHKLASSEHEVMFLPVRDVAHAAIPRDIRVLPSLTQARNRIASPEVDRLASLLHDVSPEVIHAGPLTTCSYWAAQAGAHPLLSMSWGWDLLSPDLSEVEHSAARFALRHSSAAACDCDTLQSAIVGIAPHLSGRTFVFPWGVDLDLFHPAGPAFGLRERLHWETNTLVVSTRQLTPLYGAETLVRAAIAAHRQNPALRFAFAGGGELEAWSRQIFALEGLEHIVCFLGHVEEARLPGLFREADVYTSASRTDGTSISLLQAFACGRPAIVSDLPANREWVTHEVGWLVKTGDYSAFSDAILEMAERTPAQRFRMGSAARAIAELRADWSKNFTILCDAYECARTTAKAASAVPWNEPS